MVQYRTNIPQPPLEEQDIEWAVEIWKNLKDRQGLEDIRTALSICRYWHADRVDMLRRAVKGSPLYNDVKHEEELLEVYITDLKDALWTEAHINKMTGGLE